jgi:hypothetical protein
MKLLIVLISIYINIIACNSSSGSEDVVSISDSLSALHDTLDKWESYMESSSDGIWEDSIQYSFELERTTQLGGEYCANPPFYNPWFVVMTGDTLLVVDEATQSLVCMDTTGTVFWKFGEAGEGPGYFAGIGQVDVYGDTIAVINNGLSFIELLDREGVLIERLSIARPQDIEFIDSRNLLVFSKDQPGGDVHLLDTRNDSVICSFGDGEWEYWPTSGARYEIWGEFISPDKVAYISHFEKKLVFASIVDHTSYHTNVRNLPFTITPHGYHIDEENNTRTDIAFPLYRSMFIGPSGQINIVFCNLMADGNMYGPGNTQDRPPVTVVDRFNFDGEYLDSYCIPDSSINCVYYNGDGYMLGIQSPTGTIYGYRIRMYAE